MADVSRITALDGVTYTIKDSSAVEDITCSGSNITVTYRNGSTATYTVAGATYINVTVSSEAPSVSLTGDVWFVIEGGTYPSQPGEHIFVSEVEPSGITVLENDAWLVIE